MSDEQKKENQLFYLWKNWKQWQHYFEEVDFEKLTRKCLKKYHFPHKLYDLLTNANKSGNTDTVLWSSDDTVFIVHDYA